jgi:hypothetical protein
VAVDSSSPHIFISFSSRDQAKAEMICDCLENAALPCWISLRNVEPGANYQASIVEAIQHAKIMVLTFSDNTNQSVEVHKELALASAFKLSVMPVRITDVKPNGALLYELATRQWINAFEDWDMAMARLIASARAVLSDTPLNTGVPEATFAPVISAPAPIAPMAMPEATLQKPLPAPVAFSKEQLDTARAALAFHLGPIADVLIRKARAKAGSLTEFHEQLAAHIQTADAQKAFLQRVRLNK